MNCEEVRLKMVSYLEEEVSQAERVSIEQHLAECNLCQIERTTLMGIQRSARQALQSLAARAEPSSQALLHLQLRLAEEARPSSFNISTWQSRLAPGANHNQKPEFIGEQVMRKRMLILAIMVLVAVSVIAIFAARSFTPVSAKQILERATAAQTAVSTQGIEHTLTEVYGNYQALAGDQAGSRTIAESYHDLQDGHVRWVVKDADSGKVLNVFAYDGRYTYSSRQTDDNSASTALIIYRVPQSPDKVAFQLGNKEYMDPDARAKQLFEQFRSDPQVQVVKRTEADGRIVFILSSQQPVKTLEKSSGQTLTGTTNMIFDAQTYRLLESRTTVQRDGQEILVSSERYLADEILPAETQVTWDLSDLQGVKIVDDPYGQHGDALPEDVSIQDLVAQGQSPYVLERVPDGFSQEISAAPGQPEDQPLAYVVSYRDQAGDYFVIQPDLGPASLLNTGVKDEVFQTASGLEVHFSQPLKAPQSDKQITLAIVVTADGSRLIVTSSLPRQQVKVFLEDLVRIKG